MPKMTDQEKARKDLARSIPRAALIAWLEREHASTLRAATALTRAYAIDPDERHLRHRDYYLRVNQYLTGRIRYYRGHRGPQSAQTGG